MLKASTLFHDNFLLLQFLGLFLSSVEIFLPCGRIEKIERTVFEFEEQTTSISDLTITYICFTGFATRHQVKIDLTLYKLLFDAVNSSNTKQLYRWHNG